MPAAVWRSTVSAAVLVAASWAIGPVGAAMAAIAFVGRSTAQTVSTGATTLSLSKPTGVAAGEIEVASVSVVGAAGVTPPSGWTQIVDTPVGTLLHQASFWHVATASEGSTTWTLGSSTEAAGGIAAYSGADTTTIVDAEAAGTGTSGTAATVPSLTTTYAGDFIIGLASFNNSSSLTADAATASRYTSRLLATNGPSLLAEDATQANAGSSAAQTVTDATSATAWAAQAIALKPASAAGVLSVQTTATPSFSANLNNGDQTVTFTLPLTTTASVSPGLGWNETITSTEFTSASGTLPATASTIAAAPSATCNTAFANCTAPTNAISYPVAVPAGPTAPTAVKFFDAAAATGTGMFTITPTVTVSVPQNSFAGTYTSTLTIAIASGP